MLVYKIGLFFLYVTILFGGLDSYQIIEDAEVALNSNQEKNIDYFYNAAQTAYNVEEYDKAIAFLRHINNTFDTDQYDEEKNRWIRMGKEVEILTNRYKNDASEKDDVISELKELSLNMEYYKNCNLIELNFDKILEGSDTTDYQNCAFIEYQIGKIFSKEEEYDKALKHYKVSSKLNPYKKEYQNSLNSVFSYYITEGGDYAKFNDYGSAVENYLIALKYMPMDNSMYMPLLYRIAQAYYYDKEESQSLVYLDQLISIESEDYEYYKTLYLMGECYRKMQDYDSAIEKYNEALEEEDNAQAYYKLGRVYAALDQYDDAIYNYEYAIYYKENYHQAYESLGIIYQNLGKIKKAIENYKKSISYNPKNVQCLERLAVLHNNEGEHETAKLYAEECLVYKRSYAGAYYEIGRAEKSLGNLFAAMTNFEKAKKSSKYRKSAEAEIELIKKQLSD